MKRFSAIFLLCLAFSVNAYPLDCDIDKWSDQRFDGKLGPRVDWVENEQECAALCYEYDLDYASKGFPCKSFNFIKATRSCQMLQNQYAFNGQGLNSDPSSNYVIVKSCKKPGNTPTPTQPPTQPPVNPSGGGTNNIRPGSCGQASVAQRFSRAALAGRPGQRIVGGVEARQNSVPFIVSLRKVFSWIPNGWHSCGGTLIRVSPNREESDIVVTAAHCIKATNPPDFYITAGAHYASRPIDGEQSVNATFVVVHPSYNSPQGYANDLAIVKLAQPIKFTKTVQPACLPSGRNDVAVDGQRGIVAGWGALQEGGSGPDALMQVMVPVMGTETCQRMENIHPESMLCAGYEAGQKDACQGDSGGPYFVEGREGYTLQGVVSWGSGCARPRAPGIYSKVANFVDWIQDQVRRLSTIAG